MKGEERRWRDVRMRRCCKRGERMKTGKEKSGDKEKGKKGCEGDAGTEVKECRWRREKEEKRKEKGDMKDLEGSTRRSLWEKDGGETTRKERKRKEGIGGRR